MTVPERFTQIKFVAQDIDTIVVRLPPPSARTSPRPKKKS